MSNEIRKPFRESDIWISPYIKGEIYTSQYGRGLLGQHIHYEIKLYDKPCKYGLNKGKIWKFAIRLDEFKGINKFGGVDYETIRTIAQWDDIWVVKPESDDEKIMTNMLINMYS